MLELFNVVEATQNKKQYILSDELLLNIFLYSDQKDLCTISLACKKLYNLSSSNLIWIFFALKLNNFYPTAKDLPSKSIDYKNKVYAYNKFFEFHSLYSMNEIPTIYIACLGKTTLKYKFLEGIKLNPKLNLINYEVGPKKQSLKFWNAVISTEKNNIFYDQDNNAASCIIIFFDNIVDLNIQYRMIKNSIYDFNTLFLHIICCSNNEEILDQAKKIFQEFSVDVFKIHNDSFSTSQWEEIQNKIILNFFDIINIFDSVKNGENLDNNRCLTI